MDFRIQFPRPHMEGEEEEDLEALRLAALQSLKRKASEEANNPPGSHNYNGISRGPRKRGRYYNNPGRPGNGQFSKGWSHPQGQFGSRLRNTNLISITPQTDGSPPSKSTEEETPKLILPQDRYNKLLSEADKPSGSPVSKFDRYDKSESEEEEESEQSDQGTLKRANSLEELIQELEDEIQGQPKNKESKPVKNKVKRKKSQPKIVTEDVQSATCDSSVNDSHGKQAPSSEGAERNSSEIDSTTKVTQVVQQPNESLVNKETSVKEPDEVQHSDNRFNRHRLNRSPNHRKSEFHRRNKRNFHNQNHPFPQPLVTQNPPFPPFLPFHNGPIMDPGFSLPSGGFVPTNIPPPALPIVNFIPNRPVSPLAIDTDSINAVITAPLSPRSAAFVLENRAIIEKRKRSPRRSYSRSPSPRNRYSISPRRSFSPRGSLSPRPRRSSRGSLSPRRFSRSPKRRSRSPRRSLSPIRRRSPLGRRHSPKRARANPAPPSKSSVHNRLGAKSGGSSKAETKTAVENEKNNKSEVQTSTSTSNKEQNQTPTSTLDPVLEARRRKFESNEIKLKEGVIRLKPKETKVEQVQKEPPPKSTTPEKPFPLKLSPEKATTVEKQNSESNAPEGTISNILKENVKIKETDVDDKLDSLSDLMEDELLAGDDALDLEAPIEHLLSDVDSDPENEGRFKEKSENKPKVPVLPFTKLINGQKSRGKDAAKSDSNRRNPERKTASSKSYSSNYNRRRSRTPDGPIPARLSEPAVQSKVKGIENDSRYEKKAKMSGKLPPKSRSAQKLEKPPLTTPIESKRIEIKIRNPSKYKKVDSNKSPDNLEKSECKSNYVRKVEITKRESSDNASSSESDTEIVIENEDESSLKLDEKEVTSSDGDLRAQLSRKRAERQLYPEVERSSRLLQSALEGAVFKKSKKSKKEKEAKKDVKLPIHLRLGIANTSEVYTVKKKKSKKHRKHNLEQFKGAIKHCTRKITSCPKEPTHPNPFKFNVSEMIVLLN